MKSRNEQRVLITGANGAMAKETIKQLVNDGYRDIVMAVRTKDKGLAAKEEILNALKKPEDIGLSVAEGFDMNQPVQIREAVSQLIEGKPFDVIFLAAGFAVFANDFQAIGINGKKVEKTIFQNLVGSHIVFSELRKNNLISKGARVVLAGGEGARGIRGMIQRPDFESVESFRDYVFLRAGKLPKYNPMDAIGVSKFAGALWVKKASEVFEGDLTVIWFSPGLTSGSAGLKNLPVVKRMVFGMMFGLMNFFGKSQTPEAGGRKYADSLMGKVGKNGDLLGAPAGKTLGEFTDQIPMNPLLNDRELKEELWRIVEEVSS